MELLERDRPLSTLAEGRVVVVTGEPGIGKTSLVTEFLRGQGALPIYAGGSAPSKIPVS